MPEPDHVTWTGELLWPIELPAAGIIDVSQVTGLGSWVHAWLRERPQTALVGLATGLRRQLQEAGVPALYYRTVAEASDRGGVSPSERAMLWE